jgi:hypothetical protein
VAKAASTIMSVDEISRRNDFNLALPGGIGFNIQ